MNTRSLTIAVSVGALLLLIIVAAAQSHRASTLRIEKQTLLTGQIAPVPQPDTANTRHDVDSANPGTLELLQLRSQVSQLMQRRRELETERTQNEQLRAQLSARNASTKSSLAPNYIHKQQARWLGQNTPENTLESFLWAVQHRNFTNLVSLLTPNTAAQMRQMFAAGETTFFDQVNSIPGMRIADQKQLPDGSIEAKIEVVPGEEMGKHLIFRMIDGQWKMDFNE